MLGYKYRAINQYSLETLQNNTVYFSPYTDFNDPFEFSTPFPNLPIMYSRASTELDILHKKGILKTPIYLHLKNICEDIIKDGDPKLDSIHYKIREKLKTVGIYSLSSVNDEILMWSHYADNHKGFCIGFDTLHKNTTPQTKSFPVNYRNTFSDLNDPDIVIKFYTDIFSKYRHLPPRAWQAKSDKLATILKKEDDLRGGISVLTDKYHKWSYEQEFRLVDEKTYGVKKFKPKCLKSITFGLRTSEEDKLKIIEICKRTDKKHVIFFQAEKSRHSFELEIVEIKA
ncbi:DUF2971 domain-containing protein [Pseudomonas zeae]|uniref:DUF2971 domain-containing protein n=1 Tax=Pseudomonas zeae TaxID=2745510 RepID=A0A9E6TAA6_9PSED|nr:DUF2971 domain-containing protein [Pseudomonas zeae]QXI10581.1 DUF2971 domain-containing protein [Pseudomonas zeae]